MTPKRILTGGGNGIGFTTIPMVPMDPETASHGSDLRPSTFFLGVKIILIRPKHGNRTEWLIIEMLSGSIPLLKPCSVAVGWLGTLGPGVKSRNDYNKNAALRLKTHILSYIIDYTPTQI